MASALHSLTLEDLRSKLSEALASRHAIMTRASSVSFSGRSVSYQQRLTDLDAYINALQAAIDVKERRGARGPIYLVRG